MKVQELIKKLLEFDPELEVMYRDEEYGESDINEVRLDQRPNYSNFPKVKGVQQFILLR